MSYKINSLEQLNSINYDSFSKLEKISFELDRGEFVNDAASKEYGSIVKKINEELGECGCTWDWGSFFEVATFGTGMSVLVDQFAAAGSSSMYSSMYIGVVGAISVISALSGIKRGKRRAKKQGYELFSELRNRINQAYESSRNGRVYQSPPPALKTIEEELR